MKASRLGLKERNIHFGMFDFSFVYLEGPRKNVEKFVRWKLDDYETPIQAPAQAAYGAHGLTFYRPGYVPILWLPRKPRTAREHGTVAHEVLHIVVRLMNWADVTLSSESEEVYCHAVGFAVTQVLEGA